MTLGEFKWHVFVRVFTIRCNHVDDILESEAPGSSGSGGRVLSGAILLWTLKTRRESFTMFWSVVSARGWVWSGHIVTDVTRIINTNTGSLRRKTTLNLETNTEKHNCGRLDFNSVNTNKYFNSQQVSGYIKGLRRQQWRSNLHFTFKFFWETHLFHVSLPSLGSGVEMKSVSFHLLEDKCF